MAAVEKALRRAAVAQLVAASTAAGSRVYSGRSEPIRGTFPVITVSTLNTNAEKLGNPAHRYSGEVQLTVSAWTRSTDASDEGAEESFGPESDLEDSTDDLDDAIRVALLAKPREWLPDSAARITQVQARTIAQGLSGDALARCRSLNLTVQCEFEHVFAYGSQTFDRADIDYHPEGTTLPEISQQVEIEQA